MKYNTRLKWVKIFNFFCLTIDIDHFNHFSKSTLPLITQYVNDLFDITGFIIKESLLAEKCSLTVLIFFLLNHQQIEISVLTMFSYIEILEQCNRFFNEACHFDFRYYPDSIFRTNKVGSYE